MQRNLIALAAAACLVSGCAETRLFTSVSETFGWGEKKTLHATAQNPAVEIVCMWQPAQGRGPNGLPVRGLAGQLMFFTRREPTPVIVDGDVRIYLFDNRGTAEQQAKPIHQQDHPAAQWQAYLQNGNVGPSYHLFVPYVPGGHYQVECTVQARFTPREPGRAVYSELASVTLPGTIEEKPPLQLAATSPPAESRPSTMVRSITAADMRAAIERARNVPAQTAAAAPTQPDVNMTSPYAVQQASAQVPAPADPSTERLDRMEKLLEQLIGREMTGAPQQLPPAVPAHAAPLPVPTAAPASAHPPEVERVRFQMRSRQPLGNTATPMPSQQQPIAHPLAEAAPHPLAAAAPHPLAHEAQQPLAAGAYEPHVMAPQAHPLEAGTTMIAPSPAQTDWKSSSVSYQLPVLAE